MNILFLCVPAVLICHPLVLCMMVVIQSYNLLIVNCNMQMWKLHAHSCQISIPRSLWNLLILMEKKISVSMKKFEDMKWKASVQCTEL